MTQALATQQEKLPEAIEQALINGDLSKLSVENRIIYYNKMCEGLGLNPLTKPFNYIVLNGKLVLYATKDCTDQLRDLKNVSVTDLQSKNDGDIYIVVAKGQNGKGRVDAATGAVDIKGLFGDRKANAIMKAETKAKRRLTLSLCGLGMVDESELETIQGAKVVDERYAAQPTNTDSPKTEQPPQVVEEAPKAEESAKPIESNAVLEGFKADLAKCKTIQEVKDIYSMGKNQTRDNIVLTEMFKLQAEKKKELGA